MKTSTQQPSTPTLLPDLRLPPAGSSRAAVAGLAPDTGGRRDQARSRRSGPPLAPEPRRLRRFAQASRTILAAVSAWSGERYGIDPAYLGVLLAASFELGIQRLLGR
jgi:hypothetical protein